MSQYLERALNGLQQLGISFGQPAAQPAPVLVLLDKVAHYDNDRVTAIAAVLQQATLFNQIVREQIEGWTSPTATGHHRKLHLDPRRCREHGLVDGRWSPGHPRTPETGLDEHGPRLDSQPFWRHS